MPCPRPLKLALAICAMAWREMTAKFTHDHAAAAKSIRLATGPGGADVGPYDSLVDAIKRWPESTAKRREVII